MKISNTELIKELKFKVESCVQRITKLSKLKPEILYWKENTTSWNVLECIEHLNMYGDFYIPEIRNRINQSKQLKVSGDLSFKYGWWGNYFVNAVAPKPENELNKMNAFKKLNPITKKLDVSVLSTFLKQQEEIQELLDLALHLNLNKIKTDSTIPLVKLRLGDTFRAEVYHNQRHVNQACRVVGKLKELKI
jgi:hypothetical protein